MSASPARTALSALLPPIARLAKRLPVPFISAHLVIVLEAARHLQWLKPPAQLEARRFAIIVEDLGLRFCFTCSKGRFRPARNADDIDLEISAPLIAFAQMASGVTDADTLFFQRRLKVSGDTDLGLIVKNWLDATERPVWLSRLGVMLEGLH